MYADMNVFMYVRIQLSAGRIVIKNIHTDSMLLGYECICVANENSTFLFEFKCRPVVLMRSDI